MALIKLLAIRHGQTQYNIDRKIQGDAEGIGLTELGEQQALGTAHNLRALGLSFSRFICSPLERAVKTFEIMSTELYGAELALKIKSQVEIEPRIRERSFGDLHHKTLEELTALIQESGLSEIEYRPQNGENLPDLFARTSAWLTEQHEKAKMLSSSENWLLVTHGGVLSALEAFTSNLQFKSSINGGRFKNGGINIFELGGEQIRLISSERMEADSLHV